jgi:hypothetical protein
MNTSIGGNRFQVVSEIERVRLKSLSPSGVLGFLRQPNLRSCLIQDLEEGLTVAFELTLPHARHCQQLCRARRSESL